MMGLNGAMSGDLVAWLRAQLDEDERWAKAAGWHRWDLGIVFGTVIAVSNGKTVLRDAREYDAAHIARHDPAHVLAEVEAKRRILDWHDAALANRAAHPDDVAGAGWLLAMVKVVKVLAAPYADRPGYREEWQALDA